MKKRLIPLLLVTLVNGPFALGEYRIGETAVPEVVIHEDAAVLEVHEGHPRLFFRDTDLPVIRERIRGAFRPEWERMQADLAKRALERAPSEFARGPFLKGWETGRNMAFAAVVTGDPEYVEWAKGWAAALAAGGHRWERFRVSRPPAVPRDCV